MDNEMLALYKEANRKWNEKEHLMRNVLRYKDAPPGIYRRVGSPFAFCSRFD